MTHSIVLTALVLEILFSYVRPTSPVLCFYTKITEFDLFYFFSDEPQGGFDNAVHSDRGAEVLPIRLLTHSRFDPLSHPWQ